MSDFTFETISINPVVITDLLQAARVSAATIGAGYSGDPDYIFSAISNTDGASYDERGFLTREFSIKLESAYSLEDLQYSSDYLDKIGLDNIGIWLNVVNPDGLLGASETSDDPLDQEYRLYCPLQSFNEIYPIITEDTSELITSVYYNDEPSYVPHFDLIHTLNVQYNLNEKRGFNTKYATLPGLDKYGTEREEKAKSFIESEYSSMAADIYQAMITREYVPNIITQNRTFDDINFEISLGDETTPELSIDISSYETS